MGVIFFLSHDDTQLLPDDREFRSLTDERTTHLDRSLDITIAISMHLQCTSCRFGPVVMLVTSTTACFRDKSTVAGFSDTSTPSVKFTDSSPIGNVNASTLLATSNTGKSSQYERKRLLG
uniref:Uncharacterized protein n=1 Tax=Vespula pensylvanica TaxID=30213 RepID=A0A834KQZ9_VESPE|nr:hypothetical protein H0235_013542 [Vespula pensylvanica]